MHQSNGIFKMFSVGVVLAICLTLTPQNISGKHVNLGNVTGDVVRVTEKTWHSISSHDINFSWLKKIKIDFFHDSIKIQDNDFQESYASIGPSIASQVKSPSGKVTVKIPAGAVATQTDVQFKEDDTTGPTSISLSSGSVKMIQLFELTAQETATKKAVTTFSKKLEIDVQNTTADLAGIDTSSLKLYYYDTTKKQWDVLPDSKFDPKTGILTATTDHFTIYGEQGNPNIVGPQRIMASQVDLQSGMGTFSYPLDLPAAQGGFQPKLELSYNSGSADEMKSQLAVASWVGTGWSCSLGQISYDASTGNYYLDLNGVSYQIMSADGTNYHTNPESYYKITRDTANNKWEMLDCNGYSYEFGGTTDSQQYINNGGTKAYYEWDLNLMKDNNGNPAIIHYVQDVEGTSPNEWVRSAYPNYLRYGMTNPSDNGTYKFEVDFNTATETNYGGTDGQLRPDDPISYSYTYSYACNPQQHSYACNPYQCDPYPCNCTWIDTGGYWGNCTCDQWMEPGCEYCQYPFCFDCQWIETGYWQCSTCYDTCYDTCYYTSYDTCTGTIYNSAPKVMDNRELSNIQIKVGGPSGSLLRSYNFNYTFTNRVFSGNYGGIYYAGTMVLNSVTEKGTDNATALPAMSFTYSNLTTNYNGSPSFSWPHLTQVSSGFGGTIGFSYTQVPSSTANAIWSREVVTTKTVNSGIGATQTDNYTYLGRISGSDPNPQYFGSGTSEQFRGFEKVTDTNSANNYTQHYFYTTGTVNGSSNAEQLTGKEYKTDYYDSSSRLLHEQVYNWNWGNVISTNWYVELAQATATTYQVGNVNIFKTSQTRYSYDSHGNIITEFDDGDTSTNADDSTIWRVYYPNTTTNIVDKVARQRVYATSMTTDGGGSNLKQETDYNYDSQSNTTAPTKGNLTSQVQLIDATHSTTGNYTYDSYGNMLTQQDPNGNTTTWTYDSTYHIYQVTQTDPITSLAASCTYDTGTNNLLSSTDVNGNITYYTYDVLKRLTGVYKPGDGNPYGTPPSTTPTTQYLYNSWGTINSQNLETITRIDATHTIWSADYFDGLGRVVQTQSQSATANHTVVSSTTVYNNCGQENQQYISQDIASALTAYQTPGSGWKSTSYAYDGLGRVITQTNPDGTSTSSSYTNPWETDITDARSLTTKDYYDAFARLIEVQEPNSDNSVYATTNYTYDVLGNLKTTVDANSNTTTMTYDWLSRKTGMSDPDMGAWSYVYDSNGNLTTQTDANSQTITMVYDAINRLTNKNYPTGSGMTNIVYTYDSTTGGNNGKGQRTGMTDASGTTTDIFDTRGRLTQETKTINSTNYPTGYTYDGLNRVATVTYPTGETVTNSYNGAGQPSAVSGSVVGNLVTGTTYNQLGDISEIDLNNGVKSTYGYYGTGGTYDTTGGYYGQLWEIKSSTQSTTLQDIQYTWDANGNQTQQQNVVAGQTENFSYDSLNRLTAAAGAYSQSYAYNTIGDITSMNGASYTYGSKPQAVTAVGSKNYTYDSNGNMLTAGNGNTVNTITLTNNGSGYTSAPTVTISGDGTGASATATLTATTIASFSVTSSGSGYTSAPTVTITGGGGSGAAATVTLSGTSIATLTVNTGGSGYTSAPIVSISGGGGSGAAATATLSAAAVSSITVTGGGTGYSSAPTITISGGGGSGAAATSVLTSTAIAGLSLTAGGSGYTSTPTVSFSGGGGTGASATVAMTPTTIGIVSV